jgi:XrtJ-associated TM-motif-TM protein
MNNLFCRAGIGIALIGTVLLVTVMISPRAYGEMILVQSSGSFGGCDDSPENPTLILAGLAGVTFIGSDLRRRRNKSNTAKSSKRKPNVIRMVRALLP